MKDYNRKLFLQVVECVRWCLDEDILSVSQLQKMKAHCIAYDKLLKSLNEAPERFDSAFTRDTEDG